jgi:hypothetical protein
VFRRYTNFFSRISISKIIDIPPRLSSYPILDTDILELALLYIDTLKDISLAKLAALSSYNIRDIIIVSRVALRATPGYPLNVRQLCTIGTCP